MSYQRTVTFQAGGGDPNRASKTQRWAGALARWVLVVIGGLACLATWGASAYFNVIFMSGFGTGWHGQMVWGGLSVAFDVIKATMPIVLKSTYSRRETAAYWMAMLLLMITVPISLLAGFSYAYSNRDKAAVTATVAIDERNGITQRIAEARERIKLIPEHRAPNAVRAEIDAAQRDFRYSRSEGCANATADDSIAHCRRYNQLRVELAQSQDYAELRAQIETDQKRLRALTDYGTTPDPQTALIANISGAAAQMARVLLSAAMAIAVDLVATFGFAVILTGAKALQETYEEDAAPPPVAEAIPMTVEPPMGSFEEGFSRWAGACIVQGAGQRIAGKNAYGHFQQWARFNGPFQTGNSMAFGKLLKAQARALGAVEGRSGNLGVTYEGIGLTQDGNVLALPRAAQ
ncbi:MAG: hypothetical protein SV862_00040 [Pseudomonadota bacterium]|nr:hypothetical protein [Pseudomonadota bacterium]